MGDSTASLQGKNALDEHYHSRRCEHSLRKYALKHNVNSALKWLQSQVDVKFLFQLPLAFLGVSKSDSNEGHCSNMQYNVAEGLHVLVHISAL